MEENLHILTKPLQKSKCILAGCSELLKIKRNAGNHQMLQNSLGNKHDVIKQNESELANIDF